jgi:hypothetical protein
MIAYVVLTEGQEVLDGVVDFGAGMNMPTIYSTLQDAIAQLKNDKQSVMEFEFLDKDEIIDAINAAVHGDVWDTFNVKWLRTYNMRMYT